MRCPARWRGVARRLASRRRVARSTAREVIGARIDSELSCMSERRRLCRRPCRQLPETLRVVSAPGGYGTRRVYSARPADVAKPTRSRQPASTASVALRTTLVPDRRPAVLIVRRVSGPACRSVDGPVRPAVYVSLQRLGDAPQARSSPARAPRLSYGITSARPDDWRAPAPPPASSRHRPGPWLASSASRGVVRISRPGSWSDHERARACPDAHRIASRRARQSTCSTARNASCGISTVPTCFMRRFPSFCFSRSFRFRVMSPP